MSIFDVISLFGGLSLFLYGMRLMGDSLKESSSGTLKVIMEKITNNAIKAFFLGVLVTAIIQSSTATIVITAGLVGAGILTLRQSLGIIVGANVGTTVTGQIIRLLDIDSSGAAGVLQFFKPSTLAPVALIIGIICIMASRTKRAENGGKIAMGFGILFSGLLNMTGAVSNLNDSGVFNTLFSTLGDNPFIGYLTGAGVAFVLQSSSATIGILQAFSTTGLLAFKSIYSVIVGIYLGDCVTTAIVCSIGAKEDARRVGIVNILFNLSETVVVLVVVTLLHQMGLLEGLWDMTVRSGDIANTNTIFNLGCSVVLFPLLPIYEKLSMKIIRSAPVKAGPYDDKIQALNPAFFNTPALTLRSCYNLLQVTLRLAVENFSKALSLLAMYDTALFTEVDEQEEQLDLLTDNVSRYLGQFSPYVHEEEHVRIFNEYFKCADLFERIGDHAMNIAKEARSLNESGGKLSESALKELDVTGSIIRQIFDSIQQAFRFRDLKAARHVEPLEEVVDDMVNMLHDNHLTRLRDGTCDTITGTSFLNILTNIERISDLCSSVGLAVLSRVESDANFAHSYLSKLHRGSNEEYNTEYAAARKEFFDQLESVK